MHIDQLDEHAWERFRRIRLASLQQAPEAFGSRYEDLSLLPEQGWRRQLRQLTTFVADIGGRDVGVVRAVEHADLDDTTCLISMWVHPAYRRRRVGSALIDRVMAWAREMRRSRVVLDVRVEVVGAQKMYLANGFTPTGVETSDGGHRELQMVRRS